TAEAVADRDRGHGLHTVVRAPAGRTGPRVVSGGPGRDSGPSRAPAEDRHAGCRARAGPAGGEPLPARLGAHARRARSAPTAEASRQAGAHADLGQEPVALPGDEPGRVPKEEAVERARPN